MLTDFPSSQLSKWMVWRLTGWEPKKFTYCGPTGGVAGNSSQDARETLRALAKTYLRRAGKNENYWASLSQEEALDEVILSRLAKKKGRRGKIYRNPRITFMLIA